MKTINPQHSTPLAGVTPDKPDAEINTPQPGKVASPQSAPPAGQTPDHEITPRQVPLKDPGVPAPKAAKGDDDLMSKQQHQSMPSADEIKGKWKQQVGAAKIAWGKLTDDELLKTEGHAQKLTGLVQERYALSREQADKQVASFFEKN